MSYSSEVLADSPVSYFKLDETSGTVAADTANGHDATYVHSPTFNAAGAFADSTRAVTLGTASPDALISLPTAAFQPGTGSWTIEGWVRVGDDLDTSVNSYTFYYGDDGHYLAIGISGVVYTGDLNRLIVTLDGVAPLNPVFPNDNAWHHVVVTYDSGTTTVSAYIDNVLSGSATSSAVDYQNDFLSVIGGYDATTNSTVGDADDFAFYHTALSSTRIAVHYLTAVPPPPAPATPSVTYVDPVSLSTLGGTGVLIVGINLTGVSSVLFGATPATSFVEINSTQVYAVAPAHSAGTVDVTVTTSTGTSPAGAADQVTYRTPSSPAPITFSRWVLHDPVALSSATFEINPSEGGEGTRQRVVAAQSRRAVGNKTNVITNAGAGREFSFTGTILTEAQYNLLTTWFNKTNPIEITDDLGQTFTVYIKKFEPRRVRKSYNPWFHTYTVTGVLR